MKGVRLLRALYLRGCCGAAALAEVAAAVEAHGAIVLCDLHAADAEEAAAETAKAAAKAVAVAAAGGGAKGALLVDVFDSMDVDGSGTVDIAEYRSAVGNETMRAFFAYIDAQGVADGELTLGEWLAGMGQLGAAMSDAEFFAELDGHLVKVEMSNRRKATLTEIFAAMDADHDGNVSLDEYRAAVASTTMRSFFEYIDGKGVADGFLTLGEWLAGMSEIGASMSDAEFLDELKKLLVDLDIPVGLDKASRAGDDIAAGEGPLQPSISASRWSLGLMWDELLPSFPAAAAEAAAAAFRSLPGATAAAAPLDELLCRLLPADEAVALGCHPPGAELPWGGYVQWLADFFANRWDADAGPDAPFARLMRALATPAPAPRAVRRHRARGRRWRCAPR